MGLDITAYRGLKLAEGFTIVDGEVCRSGGSYAGDEAVRFYIDKGCRAPELSADAVYVWTERANFRAGSYSGYSEWRNNLAVLAGWRNDEHAWGTPDGAGTPFMELINFSDCEGVIGAAVSAKLAKDFAEWQERAVQYGALVDDDGWFLEKFGEWRRAFEMAADNGAVRFH
jgi:hypothetical protein